MKNFSLSRRACLRGAGVALGLPMLEAMLPFGRRARAQAAAAGKPIRLLVWTFPDGARMDAWRPTATGSGYTLPPILTPLAAYKDRFNVVSGLANTPASVVSGDIFAGSHARATGAMLTQVPLTFTSGTNFKAGISFDQVIANDLKVRVPSLRLPSLEVGAVYAGATGNCEDGFSCAYLTNLAWSGPTTFLPKETNPRAVFDRLVAGGLPAAMAAAPADAPLAAASDPAVDKTLLYRKNVLDLVAADTADLKMKLGRADQTKLGDYLDAVNELQRRVTAMIPTPTTPPPTTGTAGTGGSTTPPPTTGTGGTGGSTTPPPTTGTAGTGGSTTTPPPTTPMPGRQCTAIAAPKDGTYLGRDRTKNIYTYTDVITAMDDLIAMAFTCDLTRVVTFMSEIPLNTQTDFSFMGVNTSNYHNDISHHGGDPAKLDAIQKVNTWYATQFAGLLAKLAAATDVDGSPVLDNCIILFTSEFGDGDNHYHYDLPMLVAGRGGGAFTTGRHINYPSTPDKGTGAIGTARRADKPLANLYISIMQAFGMNVSTFGSVDGTTPYGTAPLTELRG